MREVESATRKNYRMSMKFFVTVLRLAYDMFIFFNVQRAQKSGDKSVRYCCCAHVCTLCDVDDDDGDDCGTTHTNCLKSWIICFTNECDESNK